MKYFYNSSTGNFQIGGDSHDGFKEIDKSLYESIFRGQSQGMSIEQDLSGMPVSVPPRPSAYHTLDLKSMEWSITKANQEKIKSEAMQATKSREIEKVSLLRAEADALLAPLQYRERLGLAEPHHISEAEKIMRHIIDLDDWRYPDNIPTL